MYDDLKLSAQVCFPIYSLSKEIINIYRPFLDAIDLTYSQYLVMLVLWEHKRLTMIALGELLHLDSGTLSPLLKRLERKQLLVRKRNQRDERVMDIEISPAGEMLEQKASKIPSCVIDKTEIGIDKLLQLKDLVNQTLESLKHLK